MTTEKQKHTPQTMDELDESLRVKYRGILDGLTITELKRFPLSKSKYKHLIMSEIYEHFPEAESKVVDNTAQFISNFLNNEAPKVKAKKLQSSSKTQTKRQTRSSKPDHEINRESNPEHSQTNNQKKSTTTMNEKETTEDELSDTVLKDLDGSMSLDTTMESTLTEPFLDDTYGTETDNNDSITELKQVLHTQEDTTTETKFPKNTRSKEKPTENKLTEPNDSESEIKCIDSCSATEKQSASIRCNVCMVWFHTVCVGISDVNVVGAWACAGCRKLPETVNEMKTQIGTLLETTKVIMNTFKAFTENVDKKFDNLNDRITAVVNQNKCFDESSTLSMTDIRQDIRTLKTNIDKKTDAIISKSQTIIENVKNTSDLVSRFNDGQNKTTTNTKQVEVSNTHVSINENHNKSPNHSNKQSNNAKTATSNNESTPIHEIITINDEESDTDRTPKVPHPKQQNRDLTLVTGSCILRTIETRFLAENTRVKSFNKAKIETLEEKLSNMDLSRYANIVLHIGGNDIDSRISLSQFKQKYKSLLESLSGKNCKVVISGLLPRRKLDIRPYNSTLKELSAQFEATFIDNHDSFILASGELPFEYFQAGKVNLKFPGTRLLVQNINKSCVILPPRQTPRDQSKTPQFPHRSTCKTNRNNTSRSFSH